MSLQEKRKIILEKGFKKGFEEITGEIIYYLKTLHGKKIVYDVDLDRYDNRTEIEEYIKLRIV